MCGERFTGVAADKAGTASDENCFHRELCFQGFVELIVAGKARLLRQHRQHRLHSSLGSLESKVGLSGLITGQY